MNLTLRKKIRKIIQTLLLVAVAFVVTEFLPIILLIFPGPLFLAIPIVYIIRFLTLVFYDGDDYEFTWKLKPIIHFSFHPSFKSVDENDFVYPDILGKSSIFVTIFALFGVILFSVGYLTVATNDTSLIATVYENFKCWYDN